MVTSEALQATIQSGELFKRAEHLFQVANLSMDEYNHPTRVIGSAGRFVYFLVVERPLVMSDRTSNISWILVYPFGFNSHRCACWCPFTQKSSNSEHIRAARLASLFLRLQR